MRRIKSTLTNEVIDLESNCFITVVIENKRSLIDYLTYLNNDFIGKEEYWIYYGDNEKTELSDVAEVIKDLFAFDINCKKNINTLYKVIKNYNSDELRDSILKMKDYLIDVTKELSLSFEFPLSFNENIKEDELFKIVDLKMDDSEIDLANKLIKWCKVTNYLRGIFLFFFINLHTFFTEFELDNIAKDLAYSKICIINLEYSDSFIKNEKEITIIHDIDLCTIC